MGAPPYHSKASQNNSSAYIPTSETMSDPTCYADSGASYHITDNVRNLSQPVEYRGKNYLIVGNGEKLSIAYIRNSYLHTTKHNKSLLLKNMLHVPNIKKKLFSISQLTAFNDITVEFDLCGCFVMNGGPSRQT